VCVVRPSHHLRRYIWALGWGLGPRSLPLVYLNCSPLPPAPSAHRGVIDAAAAFMVRRHVFGSRLTVKRGIGMRFLWARRLISLDDSRWDLWGDFMAARLCWRLSQGCLDGPGGQEYEGPDLKYIEKARERAGARSPWSGMVENGRDLERVLFLVRRMSLSLGIFGNRGIGQIVSHVSRPCVVPLFRRGTWRYDRTRANERDIEG